MKKLTPFVVLVWLAVAATAQSQTATAPAPSEPATIAEALSWATGTWEGDGKARAGEFTGKMTVTEELDGMGMLINRTSMTKSGDPTGGMKELFLIGFDASTKKIVATLYDNKSSIALYVGELKDHEIDFSLATAQPGYVSHRVLKQQPDGTLYFLIESATPGKEVSKQVEITFRKK